MAKLNRVTVVGGGPAGLATALRLSRLGIARHVTVLERDAATEHDGWGISLNDAALGTLRDIDPVCAAEIERRLHAWDRVTMVRDGEVIRAAGTPLAAISRADLLTALRERCREFGVRLRFTAPFHQADLGALADEADLVVGADGAASEIRAAVPAFGTTTVYGSNKYIWLAVENDSLGAAMVFRTTSRGQLFAYAYPYAPNLHSFIVECTDATWHRWEFDRMPAERTARVLSDIFTEELSGARLLPGRARWSRFGTVRNERWCHGNVVLIGDAAHTTHFSVGLGTVFALDDALALVAALDRCDHRTEALRAYEARRRPAVEQGQLRAAESQSWFERFERYNQLPPAQFAFSWRTRQHITTYERLDRMDPGFTEEVCRAMEGDEPGVREPIRTRLRDLPPGTNRVVAVVDAETPDLPGSCAGELDPAGLVMLRLPPGPDAAARFAKVCGRLPGGIRAGVSLPAPADPVKAARLIADVVTEGAELVGLESDLFLPWDPDQVKAAAGRLAQIRSRLHAYADAAGGPVLLRLTTRLDDAMPDRRAAPGAGVAAHLPELTEPLAATGCCAVIDTSPAWTHIDEATAWHRAVEMTDVLRNVTGVPTMLTTALWRRDIANTLVGAGRLDLVGVPRSHADTTPITLGTDL